MIFLCHAYECKERRECEQGGMSITGTYHSSPVPVTIRGHCSISQALEVCHMMSLVTNSGRSRDRPLRRGHLSCIQFKWNSSTTTPPSHSTTPVCKYLYW